MCGIFGYIGPDNDPQVCIEGLEKLEYRGYDSAGLAGIDRGKILTRKRVGKVKELKELLNTSKLEVNPIISHTRWATHGEPTEPNAHPHFDPETSLALVHNGIIENFQSLRKECQSAFATDTDTEVIAHLIADAYTGDLLAAVSAVTKKLEGSFALAVIHKDHPDEIIACGFESPLAIGLGKGTCYVASCANAFVGKDVRVVFLTDGEIARCTRGEIEIFKKGQKISREPMELDLEGEAISKNGFEHFMLKEIHEQPQTICDLIDAALDLPMERPERIVILGCGSSWHAGSYGACLFQEIAHIPASAEIASEFRYSEPIIDEKTLVIAISQSGETADTLAAVRKAKDKGAKILGLCNVNHSTLTRDADHTLFLHAGQEISVCSTKAFTNQLTMLVMLATHFADLPSDWLKELPTKVRQVIAHSSAIEKLAIKYSSFQDFFFIGRRHMFPTALEAALKLKEISYLGATAYPAGEMKHGPIALVGPALAVIALCGNTQTQDKMRSNMMEVKARGSPMLAFIPEGDHSFDDIATDKIELPECSDILAPILYSVACQLFAYYVAKEKETDIDQPKNLAKSVTVE